MYLVLETKDMGEEILVTEQVVQELMHLVPKMVEELGKMVMELSLEIKMDIILFH